MKIIILGAGALGSLIGGHLARTDEQVIVIARGQRAAFLQEHGIIITGLANFTVPVHVTTQPHAVREADVLLITVKTYDTEPALASVSHLEVSSVLAVQNGVLKDEQVARYFGWPKTLGATTSLGGAVMPDGVVHFLNKGRLVLGEVGGGRSARAQTLAAVLTRAGIDAEESPQIQTAAWSKYVAFVSIMAVGALTRLEVYKCYQDHEIASLMVVLMRETARLAERLGIPLEDIDLLPVQTLCRVSLAEAVARLGQLGALVASRAPTLKTSTLQDLERGRRLEVEEILGYAVRKGAELRVPLPAVEACYRLLAGVNRNLQAQ